MKNKKLRHNNITHSQQRKLIKNNKKFSQQEVTFEDTPLFFPEGLEKLFLLIYFISLPYLAGHIFIFFYVGNSDTSLFIALHSNTSHLLTWIIGYELLAILTLLWILKKAIEFTMENSISSQESKNFKRP